MHGCRLRGHCGTGQFIPILATTAILILGDGLRADTKEYSYISDADKGTLFDYQFIKSVNDKLEFDTRSLCTRRGALLFGRR